MNIVFIIVICLLILAMLNGLRKGLIRTVFSTFIIFAALAVAAFGSSYAANFLQTTPLYNAVNQQVERVISSEIPDETAQVTEQIDAINNLPLPDGIKETLIENNNSKIYEAMGIDDFAAYISDYISMMILKAIAFVGIFILAFIILKIIEWCLEAAASLPVLHSLNRLGGLLFGAVNGLMTIWFFFIIVTIFASTQWGAEIFRQINESIILSFIYNNNYLLVIIMNITKMIFG